MKLSRSRVLGIAIIMFSLGCLVLYTYLLFLTSYSELVLKLTVWLGVATVLLIVALVGYVIATTPPPQPLKLVSEEEHEEGELKS